MARWMKVKDVKEALNDLPEDMVVEFRLNTETYPVDHTRVYEKQNRVVFSKTTKKINEMSNRFVADHTTRKGFWIEDFKTGKRYYFDNEDDVGKVLELLNFFDERLHTIKHKETIDTRYCIYYKEKYGRFVVDRSTGKYYNLGISTSIAILRDFLNEYDYLVNGKTDLPHQRVML